MCGPGWNRAENKVCFVIAVDIQRCTGVKLFMMCMYVTDVDLFGAKPFTVPTPPTLPAGGDVFGMPVFSPVLPISTSDQEAIDMQVLHCLL